MTRRRRCSRGSVTPLIIGFAAVVAMLVTVVVDVSAAFLRREAMNAVADGAALAATDGLQGEQAYRDGLGERITMDPVVARRFVAEHLISVEATVRFPGLSWSVDVVGTAVVVRLRAPFELPLHVPGAEVEVQVGATSAAVVRVSG